MPSFAAKGQRVGNIRKQKNLKQYLACQGENWRGFRGEEVNMCEWCQIPSFDPNFYRKSEGKGGAYHIPSLSVVLVWLL